MPETPVSVPMPARGMHRRLWAMAGPIILSNVSVPVLGALFASRSYLKKETDLAIIVTPRLVRPARPGSVIATPLDNTTPANDADFFLTGNAELTRTDKRALVGFGVPFSGHILDFPKGATNVVAVRN